MGRALLTALTICLALVGAGFMGSLCFVAYKSRDTETVNGLFLVLALFCSAVLSAVLIASAVIYVLL